jgi:hypothetical protein
MFRLPVSGYDVQLRLFSGAEDLLLLESRETETEVTLNLLERLAQLPGGEAVACGALPVTDVEALLLELRRITCGETIRTDINCPVPGCGVRIDVDFEIGEYLAHHRPKGPRGVEPDAEQDWFRLTGGQARFRLPTAADQIAAFRSARPERELVRRCVDPADLGGRALARVETAMASLAPALSEEIQGTCPSCRATVWMQFDVQEFVLSELRNQASFLFEDVDRLATRYHWSEESILGLPSRRRTQYAEMAKQTIRAD